MIPEELRELVEDLDRITGMTAKERQDAIRWYARQSEALRIEVMRGRFKTQKRLVKDEAHENKLLLDYAAFLISVRGLGWLEDKKVRTRAAAEDPDSLERVALRRKERIQAGLVRKRTKREILARSWGKVREMRRDGLSFEQIAKAMGQETGRKFTRQYIQMLWKEKEQ